MLGLPLTVPTIQSCLVSLTHVPLFSLDQEKLMHCVGGREATRTAETAYRCSNGQIKSASSVLCVRPSNAIPQPTADELN